MAAVEGLRVRTDPRLIAGFDKSEDAGVYKLNDDTALIHTVDFFTPILDDPYEFGQVAAANALSDVYAMGGVPLVAMNIVCYPCSLGMDVLHEILMGGADKVFESGALLVGGHSVDDAEPKYGLAVTGLVHPDRVMLNSGARPGDVIILTKPIGTGLISTAMRAGMASPETEKRAYEVMSALNLGASAAMQAVGAHGCTDITGFGLLGHMCEMALASGVAFKVSVGDVPMIEGASEYAAMGLVPGGTKRNAAHFRSRISAPGVSEESMDVLFDPQTSGGLLIAVAQESADELIARLRESGALASAVVAHAVAQMELAPTETGEGSPARSPLIEVSL